MKKYIALLLAVTALSTSAFAQRVPDSSVTGVARATVGIEPITNLPTQPSTGDTSLSTAYDPSWSMLIGDPTQTKIPRKFCNNISTACAWIDSAGRITAKIWNYPYCYEGYCVAGSWAYYTGGPATGSGTVQIARAYSGATLTASPIITTNGKLVGWSYSDSVFTGAYQSASYSNSAFDTFSGPVETQWYCYGTAGGPCGGMSTMKAVWTIN